MNATKTDPQRLKILQAIKRLQSGELGRELGPKGIPQAGANADSTQVDNEYNGEGLIDRGMPHPVTGSGNGPFIPWRR